MVGKLKLKAKKERFMAWWHRNIRVWRASMTLLLLKFCVPRALPPSPCTAIFSLFNFVVQDGLLLKLGREDCHPQHQTSSGPGADHWVGGEWMWQPGVPGEDLLHHSRYSHLLLLHLRQISTRLVTARHRCLPGGNSPPRMNFQGNSALVSMIINTSIYWC